MRPVKISYELTGLVERRYPNRQEPALRRLLFLIDYKMHKSEVFFRLTGGFLLGVSFASLADISQWLWLAGLAISIIVLFAFWLRHFYRHVPKTGLRGRNNFTDCHKRRFFSVFLVILFIFGGLRMESFRNKPVLTEFAQKEENVTLTGYVSGEVQQTPDRQEFRFMVKEIRLLNKISMSVAENANVTLPVYPEFEYGDKLKISGKIELPKSGQDFDYARYLAASNIFSVMQKPIVAYAELELNLYEKAKVLLLKGIFNLKDGFQKSIEKSVTEPNSSFINGILLGSRGGIPDKVKNDFKITGTSHILAISGYNVTIIASMISWLLLSFLKRQRAFWGSVLAVALFAVLTGASASVVRAALMGILVLLAGNVGRIYDSRNALAAVAGAMVWVNPFTLMFDAGFQLSFLATIGIIYITPVLEPYAVWITEKCKIRETFLMTLSAQLAVIPLLLFYFRSFSTVSLLANVLILPFMPLAMLLGFIAGTAGSIIPVLGMIAGWCAWIVTSYQIYITGFLAHVPFSAFSFNLPWYLMCLMYAGILAILFRLKKYEDEKHEPEYK